MSKQCELVWFCSVCSGSFVSSSVFPPYKPSVFVILPILNSGLLLFCIISKICSAHQEMEKISAKREGMFANYTPGRGLALERTGGCIT